MPRRDILIFGTGLIFGSAGTYFAFQSIPWLGRPLFVNRLPILELKPSSPISLDGQTNLKTDDIRSMLQGFAKAAGLEVVLSDKVQGSVTMEISPDISPREAIDIIVEAKGLILDEGRGVLYVKTAEERAPEPTERGRYTFRNARAADVKNLLARQLRSAIEPSVDERTNTIFYLEARSNMDTIKEFLDFVDQPIPARK